jgi:hypothetical protein
MIPSINTIVKPVACAFTKHEIAIVSLVNPSNFDKYIFKQLTNELQANKKH